MNISKYVPNGFIRYIQTSKIKKHDDNSGQFRKYWIASIRVKDEFENDHAVAGTVKFITGNHRTKAQCLEEIRHYFIGHELYKESV